jgi:hypothetical protein
MGMKDIVPHPPIRYNVITWYRRSLPEIDKNPEVLLARITPAPSALIGRGMPAA